MKKGWFYDFELLEICVQMNSKQDTPIRIESLNTENPVATNQIETQNTDNRNATHSSTTKMLTQEDKIN